MRIQEAENPLLDSEFFWYSILEGDQIIIEVDYFVDHELVLRRGRPYQILSKIETDSCNMAFIVESDITGQLVFIHPFMIDDYILNPQRPSIN
ncbi:hypothetical protein [Neptunomonas phycophila]|uniref:hypothetical protein n=1 Tax=Neptunomonas phycophila TaxID=1572645 RepID=UPI003736E538